MLIDTSVWIAFLSKRDDTINLAVRRSLKEGSAMTTDAITMEILAGSTDPVRISSWERLLASCTFLHQEPLDDALSAARLYRDCRRAAETPRTVIDCLIAAVAIRNEVPVLHRDRDFDVIARHSELQVARP